MCTCESNSKSGRVRERERKRERDYLGRGHSRGHEGVQHRTYPSACAVRNSYGMDGAQLTDFLVNTGSAEDRHRRIMFVGAMCKHFLAEGDGDDE